MIKLFLAASGAHLYFDRAFVDFVPATVGERYGLCESGIHV